MEDFADTAIELNSNIRCIEIDYTQRTGREAFGWIVTLDVLKSNQRRKIPKVIWLNSNIRCIEMEDVWLSVY